MQLLKQDKMEEGENEAVKATIKAEKKDANDVM